MNPTSTKLTQKEGTRLANSLERELRKAPFFACVNDNSSPFPFGLHLELAPRPAAAPAVPPPAVWSTLL